jgi:hypothetical protein
MTIQHPPDVVLEVAPEDEQAYVRDAYRDFLVAWNQRVRSLEHARRDGDLETAARLAEELRHVWPQPDDLAAATWISDRERQHPLHSDRGL